VLCLLLAEKTVTLAQRKTFINMIFYFRRIIEIAKVFAVFLLFIQSPHPFEHGVHMVQGPVFIS
jgi:hypothetical protein